MKLLSIFLVISIMAGAEASFPDPDVHAHAEHIAGSRSSPGNSVRHWPDLKGMHADDVEIKIHSDRPELKVQRVPKDAMVTMDMREDRVRLFVDENDRVVRAPRVG
mmetsp:Transcript_7604/g.11279  ORF Transcript_7604/g.11279 Transcript_7604/m.11279 type:complete len:106 (-) Transcript_7604:223-540(-)